MELPITKPVKFSYADEIDFNQIMEEITKEKKNCFIRVTSGSEEGYLLIKNGKKVGASYEKESKGDAIKCIKNCLEDPKTIVELFEVKPTQIDYLMDINKHYILDSEDNKFDLIVELKKTAEKKPPFKKVVGDKEEVSVKEPPFKKVVGDKEEVSVKEPPFKKVVAEHKEKAADISVPEKKDKLDGLELEDRLEVNLDTAIKKKTVHKEDKPVNTTPQTDENDGLELEDRLEVNLDTAIEEKSTKKVIPTINVPVAEQISKPKIIQHSAPREESKVYDIPKTENKTDFKRSQNNIRANLQARPRPKNDKLKVLSRREAMEIPSVIESEEKKDVDIKNKRPIPVIKKKVPETTIEKPLPAKKEEIGDVKEETQPVRKKEPDYMKRSEIMKKYGIREVDEKEIDKILNSYNGGILSDEDIEKVELTLMKKIKKSVLALSKIKGAEVMVFLDNTHNLQGTIKIITEFRGGGIISRFTGDTKEIDTLKQKIIGIAEIEIKRVFRDYPEILDKFDIEVEFE